MPQTYVPWKTPIAMKINRVAKFKQRAQLTKNPYLADLPSVKKGACVGLTFAWLSRHIQQPAESPQKRTEFLSRDDTWCRVDVYCDSFNSTLILDKVKRIAQNAPNLCGLVKASSVQAEGAAGLATLVDHINATLPGYYVLEVTFDAPRGTPSHACGIYADNNGMSFFDPNSGEYRIRADGKLAFLKRLYDHYLNYVSGTGVKTRLAFDDLYLVQLGGA